MKKESDERELAQLAACIESDPWEGEEKPPEAAIADALRLSASSIEPAPEFVERLSVQLRRKRRLRRPSPPRRLPSLHVRFEPIWTGGLKMKKGFAIAAAAALIVALAVIIPTFLGGGDHNLPPLPRLVYASEPGARSAPNGLLAGADLTLATDLPDAPAEMPVYRATTAPLPTTPEEALAWARDFGLPAPKVYRDPCEPETIFVLGDDGQQLTFRRFGPLGSVDYGNDAAAAVDGPPLPFDRAAEVAIAFLREHDLLPASYRVQEPEHFAPRPDNPIRSVQIVPELDGHPLVGNMVGMQVAVNPAGEVTYASFNPLAFERDGNYPIKSAQEAYDELSGGRVADSPFRLDTTVQSPSEVGFEMQHYTPPPPAWTIGQPVTVTGWVHVLMAEDGSDVRAELMARGGTQYDLTGPRLAELTDVGFDDVQIKGTVVAQVGEHRWQVEVADWETIPQRQPHCLVGTFTLDEDGAWLATDDGERYRLPNPPAELNDGQRIEVCADELPAAGGGLDWWSITTPPVSENEVAVGAVSRVIVAVEPEEIPPGPSGGMEAPVGIPTPEAFEIGQSVEVTGVVYATVFVNGESRRVEAFLDLDEPGEDQPPYPLSGPPEVLEAIAQLDYLHVRVRGRVVTGGQEWTPGGLSIEVEDFEQIWPNERVQAFLGHIALETLEGHEVAVFTDRETGQRYVLGPDVDTWAADYARPGAPPLGEQIWIAGVVHPTRTFAGLPVLTPHEMRSGSEIEAATSADEIPLELPQVIDESHLVSLPGQGALQGSFVVERVELAYYYEPQPGYVGYSPDGPPPTPTPQTETIIQPVWVFYGHSADNTVRFTAYVQAVTEEHVENTMP